MTHPPRNTVSQLTRLALFAPLAVFLAWRIVVLGISDHYAGREPANALAWSPGNPQALSDQARLTTDTDALRAQALLREAGRANPAEGATYMALALALEKQGDADRAAELMTLANELAPMRSVVQLESAAFWLRQGRMDRALSHWSVGMQTRPESRGALYPALLRIAAHAGYRPAFASLLREQPPRWWESFFVYAAANATDLDTVRGLYSLRQEKGGSPGARERKAFISRLEREGKWLEAYFVWLNSLDRTLLAHLGNLYNGDFELPLSDEGFAWRSHKLRGVLVDAAPTYGTHGGKALHVEFRDQRLRFHHFHQYLFLPRGRYRLRGMARPDSLEADDGVQWVVQCPTGTPEPLGATERFLGSDQWRQFSLDFQVPGGCPVQDLKLASAGRMAGRLSGTVWFDALTIERVD